MAFINDTSKPEVTNNIFGYVYINTQSCMLTVHTHTDPSNFLSPCTNVTAYMYQVVCIFNNCAGHHKLRDAKENQNSKKERHFPFA